MVDIHRKIINYSDLEDVREKNKGKKIIFCSGCFDVLHSGHAVFLNQCKQLGDILVVGLGTDKVIKQIKGDSRPINPEQNRLFLLVSFGDVDYAVLAGEELGDGKIHFEELLRKLRPDVFVLNDDDSAIKEKKALADKLGINLELVPRTVPDFLEKVSSTIMIKKMKEN